MTVNITKNIECAYPKQTMQNKVKNCFLTSIPNYMAKYITHDIEILFEENICTIYINDQQILSHFKKCYQQNFELSIQDYYPQLTIKYLSKLNSHLLISDITSKYNSSKKENSQDTNLYSIPLNSKYTFDNFILGAENKQAYLSTQIITENVNSSIPFLFIYGDVGLGKTHLMMAIGNQIQKDCQNHKFVYTTTEAFQNELFEGFRKKTTKHFYTKYRDIDTFILDDIHFISSKAQHTQEALFYTLNYLYQNKKNVIITSDRAPKHLDNLDKRIRSRLESGLIVQIKDYQLEIQRKIIELKIKGLNIELSNEIIQYLVRHLPKNVRAIESSLIKLEFLHKFEEKDLTLDLVKQEIQEIILSNVYKNIKIKDIFAAIEKVFNVSKEQILSKNRHKHHVLARQIAMYIAKKELRQYPINQLVYEFNRKDLGIFTYAENKIKKYIKEDLFLEDKIKEVYSYL